MRQANWIDPTFSADDYAILKDILGSHFDILKQDLDSLMNILKLLQSFEPETRSSQIRELKRLTASIGKTLVLLDGSKITPWLRPTSEISKLKAQLVATNARLSQSIEFLKGLSSRDLELGTIRKRDDNLLLRFLAKNLAKVFRYHELDVTITIVSETSSDSVFVSTIRVMCDRLNINIPGNLQKLLRSAM